MECLAELLTPAFLLRAGQGGQAEVQETPEVLELEEDLAAVEAAALREGLLPERRQPLFQGGRVQQGGGLVGHQRMVKPMEVAEETVLLTLAGVQAAEQVTPEALRLLMVQPLLLGAQAQEECLEFFASRFQDQV
jgi:hypothetical protein